MNSLFRFLNMSTCQLCLHFGEKSSSKSNISFFGFPKNPILKRKWIKFCQIEEDELPMNPKLCSLHFRLEDIKTSNNVRPRLRRGVIPVFFECNRNQFIKNDVSNGILLTSTSSSHDSRKISRDTVTVNSNSDLTTTTDVNQALLNGNRSQKTITSNSDIDLSTITDVNQVLLHNEVTITIHTPSPSPTTSHRRTPTADSRKTPQSCPRHTPVRYRKKLRYIGDVHAEDFLTPVRSREAFNVAKKTANKYRNYTWILLKRLNRLKAKVHNYESVITDLKKQLAAQLTE